MKKMRATCLLMLMVVSTFSAAAEPGLSTSRSTQDACSPSASIRTALDSAAQRYVELNKIAADEDTAMLRLVSSIPGQSDKPLKSNMTTDQAVQFQQLSDQMAIHKQELLVQSQQLRDLTVIGAATEEIVNLRSGGTTKAKGDPDSYGLGLVLLLRKTMNDDNTDPPDPADRRSCGLDLAFFNKEQIEQGYIERLKSSDELKQVLALRQKYNISGPFDPEKLPSPDREKAIWLQKALTEPFAAAFQASRDWSNLRRFAAVSAVFYSAHREEILSAAGASNFKYGAKLQALYESSDPAMKHAMDAWLNIDNNIPSDFHQRLKNAPPVKQQ
jgi:hypothetical protein